MLDFINGVAGYFSCSVTANWRMERLPMARRLQALFLRQNIDTVIDVGANTGQFRDFIRQEVGFAGQIHSFEPVPELHDQLAQKARGDARWTVYHMALGSQVGTLKLNVMVGSDFSSFLKPLGAGGRAQQQKNVVDREVAVTVSTLDREFGDSLRDKRAFLKVDTQGFDLEVIRGARQVLRDIPCLQTEVSFVPLYDKMPRYNEAIEELNGLGYMVADMFLVSQDDIGRALEFDCLMVRTA